MAIPKDGRVREKEDDLAREVRRMWGVRSKVIPVVVGALGSVPLRLKDNLKVIDVGISIELIQKWALFIFSYLIVNM